MPLRCPALIFIVSQRLLSLMTFALRFQFNFWHSGDRCHEDVFSLITLPLPTFLNISKLDFSSSGNHPHTAGFLHNPTHTPDRFTSFLAIATVAAHNAACLFLCCCLSFSLCHSTPWFKFDFSPSGNHPPVTHLPKHYSLFQGRTTRSIVAVMIENNIIRFMRLFAVGNTLQAHPNTGISNKAMAIEHVTVCSSFLTSSCLFLE
ncbi:uncharacterized protein LACBIDRAFT_333193 [Laccaria bicolor S238N-H82]|uniref:Predicted protein n=1 Tax=Laccaria bicolor (strain S238N-H82 / ATCC MYA-4686) TaxID=486041 RepID=B0DV70_LACBS|nr:uncharacterized protein LACBIDRAFT_333193 [Laccaria bicolor S238N-H82]EDR01460.1 predicted protein [Laccaria bicolor S238N-H82]|eukprot:XP_001887812.1 predicted protein [Laccaria bicolor S238N-H82]